MELQSTVVAGDPAVDLAVAAGYVEELEKYIVNNDLYRTVIVRTPKGDQTLQMTGGDLLGRLHRLQGQREQLSSQQQMQLDALKQQAETTIYSLRTRFHERLQTEMKSRLNTLKYFLDEAGDDRQRFRANFPSEMRNRQRIEEILKQVGAEIAPELKERLSSIDQRIRVVAGASGFIWDETLKGVYPQMPYWYLYVRP